MNKILLIIIVSGVIGSLYLLDRFRFPITYSVCGSDYTDCSPVARFKDRYSCEITKQKWGWYCDQTNKENIICQEKNSYISTGTCD